jgi:ABC-type transporter Mla subunit MlaD
LTPTEEETMASLREAAEQLTGQLEELVGQLREELGDGDVDFEKLGGIADELSARADGLAETFTSVNETLMQRINQLQDGGEEREKAGSKQGGSSRKGSGGEK